MIAPTIARLIIREHLYKPIKGKVIALGRQTVSINYSDLIRIFKEENCEPRFDTIEKIGISIDKNTSAPKGHDFVSDDLFWAALGVEKATSMDVSKYEGAGIIHDLNYPIPDSIIGQFDFILDGGTFDHLFDVKTAFENVVKMLKPDGRILQWNAASNFIGAAYLSFGPDLFYDYYVLNKFKDCKVYAVELDNLTQDERWDFYEFDGSSEYGHFRTKRLSGVIVLAEKGNESTWNKMPVQAQYRDEPLWAQYKAGQELIMHSTRKSLVGRRTFKSKANSDFTKTTSKLIKMLPTSLKKSAPKSLETDLCYVVRSKIKNFTYVGRI